MAASRRSKSRQSPDTGSSKQLTTLFLTLIGAGLGRSHHDIVRRFTWRQMQHYVEALQLVDNRRMADQIQGIALALNTADLTGLLKALREG